jgi:hypothetical protein
VTVGGGRVKRSVQKRRRHIVVTAVIMAVIMIVMIAGIVEIVVVVIVVKAIVVMLSHTQSLPLLCFSRSLKPFYHPKTRPKPALFT